MIPVIVKRYLSKYFTFNILTFNSYMKRIMTINPQFWNYERLQNVLLSVFVVWLVQEKTAYKSKSADGRLFFWCSVTENKQSNRSAEFLFQISSISFHHWDLIFLLYFCILTSENESHLYLLAKLFNSACLRETQLSLGCCKIISLYLAFQVSQYFEFERM